MMKSKRIQAGLYRVTLENGDEYTVNQIRTDAAGYGIENLWWVSPSGEFTPPCYFDPFYTKGEALHQLSLLEA
ncbi:hypothetical protein HWB90_gp039 [Mycobacterium phage Fowlmouth]|uniref:Uncharacterized protein n=2 Tax=Caudoviricetes TaxID=2731619 RepID=A0A2L1IX15_9CAUD|nr:hypothetical protein HWB51_gp035 [Mycobacterium phage Cuke]YP_009841707.1 hypothetical protein HWB90_gp039 [Mycobacterium phage Fowlmouth]AVD99653.1 hypothetical protein SEA_CUKE_35 [Mycobacterium phage Cuke]AYN57989.1 hypothetical protein SEA_FOWLMOUTH_39 [Mycobacterium phage Fowlmouth]